MVDDFDAAQIRHRQSVRLAAPACGTRLCDQFDRGHDQSGRKLRRFSYRVIVLCLFEYGVVAVLDSDGSCSSYVRWLRDGIQCRSEFYGGALMIKRTLGCVALCGLMASGSLQAYYFLPDVYHL